MVFERDSMEIPSSFPTFLSFFPAFLSKTIGSLDPHYGARSSSVARRSEGAWSAMVKRQVLVCGIQPAKLFMANGDSKIRTVGGVEFFFLNVFSKFFGF